jgi:hypothetical protein
MAQAVRRNLVHRQEQVLGSPGRKAGIACPQMHVLAQRRQGRSFEVELLGPRDRLGQRLAERSRRQLETAVAVAFGMDPVMAQHRMAAERLVEDLRVERLRVVGTHEPERGGAEECQVEQRLVALALSQLSRALVRTDRLPDSPHGRAGVGTLRNELLPCLDDAGGVAANLGHVGELHLFRVAAELPP